MYTNERLNDIFDKTNGCCHICHSKISFKNYASFGKKGAWEVEHSIPKANGGTNHLNNLFPAHIDCNRSKGTKSTKSSRAIYGNTRAPHNKEKLSQIRNDNTATGAVIGGLLGFVFGPGGAVLGATIGGAIGNSNSPSR